MVSASEETASNAQSLFLLNLQENRDKTQHFFARQSTSYTPVYQQSTGIGDQAERLEQDC